MKVLALIAFLIFGMAGCDFYLGGEMHLTPV